MPHERRQFKNGEIYHIITRRIGNELLFGDIHDYYRGIFSIYEFNNSNPVEIAKRRSARARFKATIKQSEQSRGGLPSANFAEGSPPLLCCPSLLLETDKREKLVEVLVFCLMPNHIHLLLRQIEDNGISRFMLKFGSGYSIYFKTRYQTKLKGHFFQDRFKAVHIESDDQLKIVFVYIHTNPIALIEFDWKEKGIANPQKIIKFLESKYRWSSYWDYLAKKNFPSIIEAEKKFLTDAMGGVDECKKSVRDWIHHKGEIFKLAQKFDKNKINLSLE